MKKLFLIAGLFIVTLCNAQVIETLSKLITLYGDTTYYFYDTRFDWSGRSATIDINIFRPEDNTGVLYIGGTDKLTSKLTGVTDFKYETEISQNPLTIDTTGTDIGPNADSSWWGCKFKITSKFGFPIPAFKYKANTCDSVTLLLIYKLNAD